VEIRHRNPDLLRGPDQQRRDAGPSELKGRASLRHQLDEERDPGLVRL